MKKLRTLGQAIAAATLTMSLAAGASAGEVNIGFTGPLSGEIGRASCRERV